MAYIGNVPAEKYSALTQQTFSSPTGTSFTLSTAVTNSRDIALFIDNVRQDPTSYTAVGTALTTSTIASPSTMYCLYIGKTVETISPPAGSVDSSHLVTGSVDDVHITGVATTKLTGTVTDAQIAAMAASKLTGTIADARFPATLPAISGANLTNLPTTDLTSLQTNLATNFFLDAVNHARGVQNLSDGFIDQFEDQTGVDDPNSTGETYDAGGDFYGPTAGAPLTDGTFSHTGANQTYVVPAGVTSIIFKAWGAGGGGGGNTGGGNKGGGGGFVQETLTVTPGETLNIKVGGGGVYEGAGASKKGGGGGWTSIDRSATYLAGAGAGGGGGEGSATNNGGAGGGTTGGAGDGAGAPGQGGTQSAGGAAGSGGGAGSSLTGGPAAAGASNDAAGGYNGGGKGDGDNATWTAGGGGAGYYGGGSGGTTAGGGGGGSGYAPTGTNTQAAADVVANAGDADYPGSVGNGGGGTANGENGYAVIIPAGPPSNLTLIAERQVALTAPDSAHVALFNEEVDTLTINTDILAWVSRSKQTFTATNATNVLNATTHGLVDTDRVMVISSGADLPNGLTSDIVYYVVTAATSTLQLSLTSGGAAVTFSDDGTGTHSILAVTQATLTDQGDFDTGKATLSGTVDISGQPSDTDMTLIVQTKNNKDTKLLGQSLQWS